MRSWWTILPKASLAAALSVAASLALAATVVPALGGVVDGNAWLMCVICPVAIAFPASAWQFRQAERLRAAHSVIASLHAELAASHDALQAAHDDLAERARRDGLTGLLNRDGFFAAFTKLVPGKGAGVLLIVDADHFKAINDRFGHPAGDAALRAIAEVIREVTGDTALAGRIGGEEFAIFLEGLDLARAASLAEAIRLRVAKLDLISEQGDPLPLSVSVGGACHDGTGTAATLMSEADRQLYRAKHQGRDRVAFGEPAAA
ncbi:GGDEF domain-containing protein [Bosea sp. (in: a-proteobacteria)]|jgi:diguanylate cyclase (GGDEF)-like protein|uniref:GGDEF domain-containing protein n=1 Tax=Bosea sp. (in: a-proteobacteria) TaxID=1871050 RepID=UPI001202298D|nr:GGDEF domain-containing protein [Bosea sp. (in: a-proteobacteria)]TAJ26952.1 MAG: GGDEF domain-containing protein [Bosea sp. (in: a-proteobacteria)]